MTFDECSYCDGTGMRDFLSGAKCHDCNGRGFIEDSDPDDEEYEESMRCEDCGGPLYAGECLNCDNDREPF